MWPVTTTLDTTAPEYCISPFQVLQLFTYSVIKWTSKSTAKTANLNNDFRAFRCTKRYLYCRKQETDTYWSDINIAHSNTCSDNMTDTQHCIS